MVDLSSNKTLTVTSSGTRLDKFIVAACPDYSRSYLQKIIESGLITVNGKAAKPGQRLEAGSRVDITFPVNTPNSLEAEDRPLKIIYEDDDILVIDKPPGLTTHPSPGQTEGTLINVVLAYYPDLAELGETMRPGIVHRLDKDTSGIIIIAKNIRAQLNLINQFRDRTVKKTYITLVKGHLTPETGIIDAPIGRHPVNRIKMAVLKSGLYARSEYKVLQYLSEYTLCEVRPETGRTHQIRVHMAAIGYPVVGDATYGVKVPFLKRQFLHAARIKFKHPVSGAEIELKSDLPDDLKEALRSIE